MIIVVAEQFVAEAVVGVCLIPIALGWRRSHNAPYLANVPEENKPVEDASDVLTEGRGQEILTERHVRQILQCPRLDLYRDLLLVLRRLGVDPLLPQRLHLRCGRPTHPALFAVAAQEHVANRFDWSRPVGVRIGALSS